MPHATPYPATPSSAVSSAHWAKIERALADTRWDLRSIQGIARETGLAEEDVERALRSHQNLVRQAFVRKRSRGGVFIGYTLKSRPRTVREFAEDILGFMSR